MPNLVETFHNFEPLTQFLFWIMLFLAVPHACERLRTPPVLGFILLGWLLGPHGMAMLHPEGPVSRLGSELGVGLLLFFIGFEIDFSILKRAGAQVAFFGITTFCLPLAAGFAVARAAGFDTNASVLIGSLLASHTLIAYPVVERAKLVSRTCVVATSGATVFTDVMAMVVLAICLLVHQTGFKPRVVLEHLAQIAVFVPLMIFGVSWLIRLVVRHLKPRSEAQLLLFFVLVAGASQAATLFGIDGIVGAFMAGIAARRAIGTEEPAHVLKVISNTFLIPAFFLATGMLIDPGVLVQTLRSQPLLALGLAAALLVGKYLAAAGTGLIWKYSRAEVGLTWSLTLPQVAATLAATTVAFRTVNAAGQPLISHDVLNAVLLLVVLTSLGAPLLTHRFARRLAGDAAAPQPIAEPRPLPPPTA